MTFINLLKSFVAPKCNVAELDSRLLTDIGIAPMSVRHVSMRAPFENGNDRV